MTSKLSFGTDDDGGDKSVLVLRLVENGGGEKVSDGSGERRSTEDTLDNRLEEENCLLKCMK